MDSNRGAKTSIVGVKYCLELPRLDDCRGGQKERCTLISNRVSQSTDVSIENSELLF